MSAESDFINHLYDLTVEYVLESAPSILETLAVTKTYHNIMVEQLITNADMTPKDKMAILNGYFMSLADDMVKIKNSLAVLLQ